MNWRNTTALTGTIMMISSFFLQFMEISGNSIGCRFQDVRLMAVMTPQVVRIFCVLHPIEIILIFLGLGLYIITEIMYLLGYDQNKTSVGSVIALILLSLPTLDLIVLAIKPGLLGYLTGAVPRIGYILFIVGYGFVIISCRLRL